MSRPPFRPDIEALRGVAVLLVVTQHAVGLPTGGFIGVDVFFVISGFVITAGLLHEHAETGTISLRSFLVRRARRLLPTALLGIVVTVAVSRLVFYTPRFLEVLGDGVAAAVSVQNWRLVRQGTDYFQEGTTSPLQHYWSLSVEEQFYVIWPLALLGLLALAARFPRRPHVLVGIVALAVGLSFLVATLESTYRPGWAYFSLESRAWELGTGALLAICAGPVARLVTAVRPLLLGGGVVLIGGSALLLHGGLPFPGPVGAVPVLGAALLIAAGEGRAAAQPTVPRSTTWSSGAAVLSALLRATGRISYPLYVWHFPAIAFSGVLLWWSPGLAAGVAVVVAIGAAVLTHRFVEQPLRVGRATRSRRVVPRRPSASVPQPRASTSRRDVGLAAGVLVALLVVVGVQVRGPSALVELPRLGAGEPDDATSAPFADEASLAAAIDSALSDSDSAWPAGSGVDALTPEDGAAQAMAARGCLVEAVGSASRVRDMVESCTEGPTTAARTAVVVGDSIAISWLPAVASALVPEGWRVIGIGIQSCPAADVPSTERVGRAEFTSACAGGRDAAFEHLEDLDPDVVVLSSALGSYERLVSGAAGETAMREWAAGLDVSIRRAAETGASVAVIGSPPELEPIASCASPLMTPAACVDSPSAEWVEKTAAERSAVVGAPATPTTYVAVDEWFCGGSRCPAIVDGTIVTIDGGHLTLAFAERLALVLRASLLDAVA